MNLRTIRYHGPSPMVNMGPIRLRQPLPTEDLPDLDPFVLLHHYGPYAISAEHNPFDLGPHPHRGFEPITLLLKGEQLHRDSLGNESVVRAGDVQWTTAGRGIIHAEAPTREFVSRGGELEGIQLWLNLPASKKMIPANYQHVRHEEFNTVDLSEDGMELRIIAGSYGEQYGKILTQTEVNVYLLDAKVGAEGVLEIPDTHNVLVYLMSGKIRVNGKISLIEKQNQIATFKSGDPGDIQLAAEDGSKLLILSGEPFDENVVSWGPYVMNSQTEILEAMRDFQSGKMGFLAP